MRLDPLRRHLAQASNVLGMLNSAVNFLVYCVFSRNFRSVLKRRFCMLSPVHLYRRHVGGGHDDDARCCSCHWWSRCCCGTGYRRRYGHSTGCDNGDNGGGSKRSATQLSDSRSSGTATRLTPIPCGARFGESGNVKAVAGMPFYGQSPVDKLPCL